jgi:hypothetical protein
MAKIAGSIPAEPTSQPNKAGIEPATNNPTGFGEFVGAGSIPAEPTN